MVTFVGATGGSLTVTLHQSEYPPTVVVTHTLVGPALMPVTRPEELTEAMSLSSDLHMNDVDAPDGDTVGVSVFVSPTIKLREDGKDTPEGDVFFTVTLQYGAFAAFDILEYTFIYVVPSDTAVTSPELETVAMLLLLLLK